MRFFGFQSARGAGILSVLVGLLFISVVVAAPGCGGKTKEQARKELKELKKKKEQKPPFDRLQVVTEPNERTFIERDSQSDGEQQAKRDPEQYDEDDLLQRALIKPGHWTGVLVTTRSNDVDFVGSLAASPRDNAQQPIDLPNTAFRLSTVRPVALPKGQRKTLETIFFAPPGGGRGRTWMFGQLRSRRGGREIPHAEILQHMPSYQYYLYVLARNPSRYRFFKNLDSVSPPLRIPTLIAGDQNYYRVLTPRAEAPLALPSRALAWTPIAYVVWDDVLPAVLSPRQQQAMVDWLHWGGGMIVSGPRTLDAMRGTFLEPYLPALAVETIDLTGESLAELNARWTLADANRQRKPLAVVEPWSGIKLAKHPAAEFLPGTGELVVERRVGRGRIVVTAFRLTEPELLNWRSFDSFVNACLLRRQPRRYNERRQHFDFKVGPGEVARDSFDSRLITPVRFFTRDTELGPKDSLPADAVAPAADANAANPTARNVGGRVTGPNGQVVWDSEFLEQDRLEAMKAESGVAGWNDTSAVPKLARETLREAAGISVPDRRFVMRMIGLYLLIVVPGNWLVFRVVGRVELAWLAVPVLAIGWGLVVVWLAQLNIGFARAETEVAVLEAQGGYSRAHLTRYMALYSSLSTTYDVRFDDPSALAQPFSFDRPVLAGQGRSTVTLRSAADQRLTDFIVSSNSTGMIHSEQMVDLNGAVLWQQPDGGLPVLENGTRLALSGVAVFRRRLTDKDAAAAQTPSRLSEFARLVNAARRRAPEPIDEAAWIGELAPGDKLEVAFKPRDEAQADIAAGRNESEVTATQRAAGALSLARLIELAEDRSLLAPGDVRLVGWYDRGLSGVEAVPAAAQVRRATLVVVNLRFGSRAPLPDDNLRTPSTLPEE